VRERRGRKKRRKKRENEGERKEIRNMREKAKIRQINVEGDRKRQLKTERDRESCWHRQKKIIQKSHKSRNRK